MTPGDAPEQAPPSAIRWGELVDGELRRLKRGVDYAGSIHVVAREAKEAAQELDRTAVTFKDMYGRFEYLWVQFVDGELEEGAPCPRCGGLAFDRLQAYFARCRTCQAVHALSPPSGDESEAEEQPVVEFLGSRLVSEDGRRIEQCSVLDDVAIELSCRFPRALDGVEPVLTFFVDDRKLFRVKCPEQIPVPQPETLDFALHVAGGVLTPGDYQVYASQHISRGEELIKIDNDEALAFRAVDPRAQRPQADAELERTHLHWEVEVLPDDAALTPG